MNISQIKKEKAQKKREAKKREAPKKWEKKREGTMLLSFSTLVLQSSTMIFMIERILCCHFHKLVGIFIELGLYIPMMGFLKMP